jgi:hypothetical protein
MRLAQQTTRSTATTGLGSEPLSLLAYGFFLGFAGRECYEILVSDVGTTTLFGLVIGATAALLLAGSLQLSGGLRTLDLTVERGQVGSSRRNKVLSDVVGIAMLISMALYLRDFPEFARLYAAQVILKGLALMVLPTAVLIVLVRLFGLLSRLTQSLVHTRIS